MFAFSPPPILSCNRNILKAKSSSSSYTTTTFSMHTGKHSSPELKQSTGPGFLSTSSLPGRGDSDNTIGIIGGVSVFSTLIFMEKLVWWSSRNGNECMPFIVCSDPGLSREFPHQNAISSLYVRKDQNDPVNRVIVENLRCKREFLERSGARELKAADLKPLEAGSKIRIGLISSYAIMKAGFYQEMLQKEGFEVLLPDKVEMEHIVLPAITALNRKDIEGGQNLLRIAINILLMRGVNMVVIAYDKLQGLLPSDDPLAKKCINPSDALARSTISWAQSAGKVLKF